MKPPNQKTDKRYRLLRGGSWAVSSATSLRAAFRIDVTPKYLNDIIGFRTTQSGCRQSLKK